ncbi:alpha/beta hydrolase [Sphingomonas sp.]|uniref:alpha/beta hydrolase n=1 Tax=Sphingomonas sp. TaxID=28214 RepID=UPI0035BC8DCC
MPTHRLLHAVLTLPLALVVPACVDPVAQSLYQPAPVAAAPRWTDRAPRLVTATTADGLMLSGWFWAPADGNRDLLVFLPGRAGNRDTAARQAEPLAAGGRGVLVASYRGYGPNPGTASEQGLYRDGAAFARLARTLQPSGKLYLFGDTLGAAVALATAADGGVPVDGVVTLGAFDRYASFAPAVVRPLYANAFDNVAAIRRVKVPVLIMHGRKDQAVPFAAAEKLRAAAGGTAIVAPIDGEAYHAIDLRYVAPTVWRALDEMGRMATRSNESAAAP